MKQIEVTILGQAYVLACPEGGEALVGAAVARVDQEMTAIRSAGKVRARERIAVLAALNLAHQLAELAAETTAAIQPAPAASGETAPGGRAIDALVKRVDDALSDDGQLL